MDRRGPPRDRVGRRAAAPKPLHRTSQPLDAVAMDHHLYSPLLVTAHEQAVTVSPPGLNDGEHQFVKDFRAHCERVRPEGFNGCICSAT